MELQKEKSLLSLKNKLLSEIEYRQDVLSELKRNSIDEKGFVSNFIRKFLKIDKQAPNIYWKNNETYGRYLIDADKELHNDIANAFEKSISKLKKDYHNAGSQAE